MSEAALRWAAQVQRDRLLTGSGGRGALCVLLELADCHNGKSGQCNPHLATLMASVNMSRSALYRALGALREQAGVSTRRLPNGSTQYDLPIPDWNPTERPPPTKPKKRTGGRELTRYIIDAPVERDEAWQKMADSELARTRKIMGR